MKTVIQTQIEGDAFVATTPHKPELKAVEASESKAVGMLISQLRACFSMGPVEWIENPKVKRNRDIVTRELSGLWPVEIVTKPDVEPETERNVEHG